MEGEFLYHPLKGGANLPSECYFGNTLAPTSTTTNGCDMTCSGDGTEICGGNYKMNVYENIAFVPVPTASSKPSVKERVGKWSHEGCYSDGPGNRGLPNATASDSTMTVEKCINLAADQGVKYASVEFGM